MLPAPCGRHAGTSSESEPQESSRATWFAADAVELPCRCCLASGEAADPNVERAAACAAGLLRGDLAAWLCRATRVIASWRLPRWRRCTSAASRFISIALVERAHTGVLPLLVGGAKLPLLVADCPPGLRALPGDVRTDSFDLPGAGRTCGLSRGRGVCSVSTCLATCLGEPDCCARPFAGDPMGGGGGGVRVAGALAAAAAVGDPDALGRPRKPARGECWGCGGCCRPICCCC